MQVPKSVFHLYRLANKESTRYALGGVHFERGKDGNPYAVVSDGRSLLAVTWTEDVPVATDHIDTVVPYDVCVDATDDFYSSYPPGAIELTQDGENGKLGLQSQSGRVSIRFDTQQLEGRFPRWRDVIPCHTDAAIAYVDAKRLRDLLDTFIRIHGHEPDISPGCCVTIKISTDEKTRGVLTFSAQHTNGMKLTGAVHSCTHGNSPDVPRDCDWKPGAPAE